VLAFVPLAVGCTLCCVLAFVPLIDRLDRRATRLALALVGDGVRARKPRNLDHARVLDAAHVAQSYVVFASRAILFAVAAAVVAALLGVYPVAVVVDVLATGTLPTGVGTALGDLGTAGLLVAVLGAAGVGIAVGMGVYEGCWGNQRYRANERGRAIDASLQRNIAFMFALSRSGMSFAKILRILSRNRHVYGETAIEVGVTVRDVDLFGADLIEALHRTGRRTPSADFQEFVENLASVLQSGQSVSDFLRNEYERHKTEAESQQERFVDVLATLAEGYVAALVAGPLVLITILVVIGLVLGGTLSFLRVLTYVVIPLGTVGFVVYLDSLTSGPGGTRAPDADVPASRVDFVAPPSTDPGERPDVTVVADGGMAGATNLERLDAYNRLRPARRALSHPLETLLREPARLLAVTVPIGVLYVLVRCVPPLLSLDRPLASLATLATQEAVLGILDGPLVQASLFVLGTFALVWEFESRRIDDVERAVPDFIDRLASMNEAGMSMVDSLERVVASDLGALDDDLARAWADVQWGSHVERAFRRLEARVRSPTVTRVVTLTTNAMSATNDLGPVLRIAADEGRAALRLKRERSDELFTYLVVVYLAFFVFLTIVVALDTVFVPAIPTASTLGDQFANGVAGVGQLSVLQRAAYSSLFFHAALVQAVCSGFVAGQMGDGDLRSGAKHAFGLLLIAYVVFLVFG